MAAAKPAESSSDDARRIIVRLVTAAVLAAFAGLIALQQITSAHGARLDSVEKHMATSADVRVLTVEVQRLIQRFDTFEEHVLKEK